MKRIGITQRHDPVPHRHETRDALDARWGEVLWEWGFMPIPLVSGIKDPLRYLQSLSLDGFLLTGGNNLGEAPARDRLETAVLDHATQHGSPVVGVCRGMQMINNYQNGRLQGHANHVATPHTIKGPLTQQLPRYVNSYHQYAIGSNELGHDLTAIAWAEDDTVEAITHTKLPWLGIMWHPEREEPPHNADQTLITTFLNQGTLP